MVYLWEHTGWFGNFIVIFIVMAFFVSAHYFLLPRIRSETLDKEAAGIISHLSGMLYTMLLAFIAVAGWGDYDRALANTHTEVNALSDVYRLVENFGEKKRDQIRADIQEYANLMLNVEWPAMKQGQVNKEANLMAGKILEGVSTYQPASLSESNTQQISLNLLHGFLDARRIRLAKNQEGMPILLRVTIFLGAILLFFFTFLVYSKNTGRQLLMTAVLAGFLGIVIALIFEFEYPYQGEITIPSTGWSNLIESINERRVF